MKILITSDLWHPSVNGVVVSVSNLLDELRKTEHDVRVLTLSHKDKSYIEDGIYYIKSVDFYVYPDVRASLRTHDPLIDELIEWKPDIIHSQCEFFTYRFVKRIAVKCQCPIVHTYHTMYEHYAKYLLKVRGLSELGPKLVPPLMRYILKSADTIIAPTEKVKRSLLEHKIAYNIRVIPTGIDLSRHEHQMDPEEREAFRRRIGIPEGAFVIGSLGRIAEEKNFSELLRIVPKLREEIPNLLVLLTGGGVYLDALREETQKLGIEDIVLFPGMVDPEEVTKYYQALDLFISCSVSETQGLTYIEAMANGLPEVVRKDDAVEGVIIHGKNGFIYETEDELREYVLKLYRDPQLLKDFSQAARDHVARFSKEVFGQSVLELYYEVLNKENPAIRQTATKRFQTSVKVNLEKTIGDWSLYEKRFEAFRRSQKD